MDWVAACEAYSQADAQSPLPSDEVEAWGRAAICAGLGPSALGALERLVADQVVAGDALGAARATLLLVHIRFDHRQEAIARGLLQRAALYLDGQKPSAERGLFAWMSSRLAMFQGDADLALAHAEEACMLGRMLHDPDVECLGLVCRGHARMLLGELDKGVAQHEEAAAMMRLGGVCAWVGGWALCSILHAARHRCDWARAAQFLSTLTEWTSVKGMPAYPGTCQLHRAAVLGVQGDLEQAASEARAAAALLANVAPWAEGEAYCVLGDIQLSVGDFEGAEASFRQAHTLGWDPQPGLARLHLLTGRPELALRGLEQALEEGDWTMRERRGLVLCLLVQAAVTAGDVERGREALRVLAADPQLIGTEALAAFHCLAEAEVAVAEGDTRRATQRLRQSVRHWRGVGCRVGEVEARLRLAECLLHAGDTSGAELELHAIDTHLAGSAAAHRLRLDALRGALGYVRGTPAS
jgi:ATP/maltotriose-dependent transcriptional regulator MalT